MDIKLVSGILSSSCNCTTVCSELIHKQKQAPCRTRQLRGRGSPTLPVGGRGTKSTPHCLGAMERGRPSGQHPSSSLHTRLQRTPGSLRHPQERLGEGDAQDARQEGEEMDPAVYGPLFSPEKAGSTRRGGGPEGGWGVSAPPPVGRSRSPLSSVALYPGEETGAQGLRSERSEGGDHCKIGAAAVAGETWDGGAWIVVGAEHQKKKKIQSQQR